MPAERPTERRRRVLSAYVADRLKRERAQHGHGFGAKVARETKFEPATVSAAMNAKRGVGEDFATALAEYWGLGAYADLVRIAEEWATRTGYAGEEPAAQRAVATADERYPNRAAAAAHARQMGLLEQAIRDVLEEDFQLSEDMPVLWWFDEIRDRERTIKRRGAAPPGRVLDDE